MCGDISERIEELKERAEKFEPTFAVVHLERDGIVEELDRIDTSKPNAEKKFAACEERFAALLFPMPSVTLRGVDYLYCCKNCDD